VILEAQAIVDADLGPDHPNAAALDALLGRLRTDQKRYDEALALFTRARAVFIAALGPDHSNVGAITNSIGMVLSAQGRDDEALAAYSEALALLERGGATSGLSVATLLQNLAHREIALGRGDLALIRMQRVLEIRLLRLGPQHQSIGLAKDMLGDAYALLGDIEAARRNYREAIAVFEALDEPANQAYSHFGLARLLITERRWAEAVAAAEHAVDLKGTQGDGSDRGRMYFALAQAQRGAGRDRAAVAATLEIARRQLQAVGPPARRELAAVEAWGERLVTQDAAVLP
jgi:tetratricopeptide (TPR) repeat protein